MAKKTRSASKVRPGRPRYPKFLQTVPVAHAVVLKAALDLVWLESRDITSQIMTAVTQGAHANGGKTINAGAMTKWRTVLQPHVYGVLLSGGNWTTSRANVLIAARGMGNIAATLTSTTNECKEFQLKAAFRAAKANTICLTGGVGGGSWCSFDWF
jgi:hypothetical protein